MPSIFFPWNSILVFVVLTINTLPSRGHTELMMLPDVNYCHLKKVSMEYRMTSQLLNTFNLLTIRVSAPYWFDSQLLNNKTCQKI